VAAAAISDAAQPAAAASAAAVPAMIVAPVPDPNAPIVAKPAASAARVTALPPPTNTSLVDDLMENAIVPAVAVGLIALLLGAGFYRARQRKKSSQVDSSFLESRLQPDSFFGASGGQRIDTNEGSPTGSSMVYSPSQLDAAGDVDPVAEADVYLAYGRDLQAEEILKEAMRTNPQRVAIHSKLLEIYSKRRDAKAFELVATEAYSLTHGEGPEWEHICELGQELDPGNPLYRPGGQPTEGSMAAAAVGGGGVSLANAMSATQPMQATSAAANPSDLDLDLDFSLGDDEPAAAAPVPVRAAPAPVAARAPAPVEPEPMPSLDMDFDVPAPAAAPAASVPTRLDAPDPMLSGNSFNLSPEPVAPARAAAPAATPAPAAAADSGMIEFDMGSLSLDLPSASAPAAPAAGSHSAASSDSGHAPLLNLDGGSTGGFEAESGGDDPLATKLALAQEFNAIGDPDGARSLAEEVLAEASGDLKTRAQRFLAEIN
jgi:pilus assembly protein FimV